MTKAENTKIKTNNTRSKKNHTKTKTENTRMKSEAKGRLSAESKPKNKNKRLNISVEKSERELLLELLEKVFYEGEFIHLALRKLFSDYPNLGGREKAFLTRGSHGILERYLQLD